MKLSLLMCVLLLSFTSCKKDEDPVSPVFSIEEQINAARPINHIAVINVNAGNWTFDRGGTATPLNDAYAESGYLVVQSSSTHYFNLSVARNVFISSHRIDIQF